MMLLGPSGQIAMLEPYLELINLIVAVGIIGVSTHAYNKAKGRLHVVWMFLIAAVGFFAIMEAFAAVQQFGIARFDGLYDICELLSIGSLFFAAKNLMQIKK